MLFFGSYSLHFLKILLHRQEVLALQTLISDFVHDVLDNEYAHAANIAIHGINIWISIFFGSRIELLASVGEHEGKLLAMTLCNQLDVRRLAFRLRIEDNV